MRRLLLAVLAVGFVVVGVVPHASYAQTTTDPPGDGARCDDFEEVDENGNCVPIDCDAGEVFVPGKGCVKPELVTCADGSQARTERDCPPASTTTSTPCPDGAAFCNQVRSCPTDTPLPPGATCEDPGPTTTTAVPVRPAPAPVGDRGTFGRPVVVEGAGAERPSPAPAPVVPDSLARTGLNEWLAVAGSGLVAIGFALVRAGERPVRPAPARRRRRGGYVVAAASLFVVAMWAASPASAEPADGGAGGGVGRETAPGQLKKAPEPEPVCPDGQLPDNAGGCFTPTCADGSEIPADGNCPPPPCPDGVDICDTRSCPVDSPLPPGALCEEDGGSLSSTPDPPAAQPVTTTVAAVERGATLGSAVQGSVFGRPADVLGVVIEAAPATRARPDLPAVAATGADTTALAVVGFGLIAAGFALVRSARRPLWPVGE